MNDIIFALIVFTEGLICGAVFYRFQHNKFFRLLNGGHDAGWAVDQALLGMAQVKRFSENRVLHLFITSAVVVTLSEGSSAGLWAASVLVFGGILGLSGAVDGWVPEAMKTPLDPPKEKR